MLPRRRATFATRGPFGAQYTVGTARRPTRDPASLSRRNSEYATGGPGEPEWRPARSRRAAFCPLSPAAIGRCVGRSRLCHLARAAAFRIITRDAQSFFDRDPLRESGHASDRESQSHYRERAFPHALHHQRRRLVIAPSVTRPFPLLP